MSFVVPKFYVLAPSELEGPYDTEAEARGQAHFRGLDVAVSEAPPPGGQVAGLRILSPACLVCDPPENP